MLHQSADFHGLALSRLLMSPGGRQWDQEARRRIAYLIPKDKNGLSPLILLDDIFYDVAA
jgi:hypothetical protein